MNKHIPKLLAYFVVIGFLSSVVFWIPQIDWLPARLTSEGDEVDVIFWAMVVMSVVILAIVMSLVIYSIRHFRAPDDEDLDGPPTHGHVPTEIVWIIIPTIIVVIISLWSGLILAKVEKKPAPGKSLEVHVDAFQFGWAFDYPKLTIDGESVSIKGAPNLVLPIDKTAMFKIESRDGDVLHSFWVPEARLKEDAVPHYQTVVQWTPTRTTLGKLSMQVVCAELCGSGHNAMRTDVCIVSQAEFEQWAVEKPAKTCEELKKELKA